ncbi:MAG: hypothetical protein COA66_10265 [Arcobacter sp.]|nr:MAG: hypothetical protein COA66_10265 [Arcobacter sp.]
MEVVTKTIILAQAKLEIISLLESIDYIDFEKAKLYLIDEALYSKLIVIDEKLQEYKTDTRRGSVYDLNKIVNILNPNNIAFQFNLTSVMKSSLITEQEKCIKRLKVEKSISKNRIEKNAREIIITEELNNEEAARINATAAAKILNEEEEFSKISQNPESYHIIISTFKERKQYGQISWAYYEKEKKSRAQKHLSINYPNILRYKELEEVDNHRTDMMVAKFIKEGYRALGNVYVKLNDDK